MSVALGTIATLLQATGNTSAAVSGSYDATGLEGLILAVIYEDGGDANTANRKRVSSVTYDGVALTKRASAYHIANNGNPSNCELWELNGPAAGSNTWQVNFSNATEDDTLHVVAVPVTAAYTVGNTASEEGTNTAAETVNNSLTFSDEGGTAVVALGLMTAGMAPVDSVSGWTVDHTNEQGAVDGGEAVVVGHYDTDATGAKTFSWSPGADTVSTRRWTFAALELVPASAPVLTPSAATPAAGSTIQATLSVNFAGTVTAQIVGGGSLAVSNVSGASCDVALPSTSVFDDSNVTWEGVRWYVDQTLRVTDDNGSYDATIQIFAPVDDHFDARGATVDFEVPGSANGDDYYVDIVSGDGEGLPSIGSFQGNTVPTVVRFRCFSDSSAKWLAYLEHTFDVSASSLDGEYADSFTGADATLITAHTPDADVVGGGYSIEKDVSTAAAPANAVTLDTNRLKIANANEGAVIDVGTTDPDLSVGWELQPGDSGMSFVAQVRRLDDTAHVHLFVTQAGLIRVNQRVNSVNVAISGENEHNYAGGFQADTTYRFRIALVGQNVAVFVDDVQVISATLTVAPDAQATKVGLFSAAAVPVYFDDVNVYSDYSAGPSLTFDAATYRPGDTVTVTVAGGALANTSYSGLLNGVSISLSAKTTSGCSFIIPDYDAFDAAGAHVGTGWYRNLLVQIDDGTNTPQGTLQIVPHVPANFGTLGAGPYGYPPVGADIGQEGYVRVKTGDVSDIVPSTLSFTVTGSALVDVKAFDPATEAWLATRAEVFTLAGISTDAASYPANGGDLLITASPEYVGVISDVKLNGHPLNIKAASSAGATAAIPALDAFTSTGAFADTPWNQPIVLSASDGNETRTVFITLTAPDPTGYAAAVSGPYGSDIGPVAENDAVYLEAPTVGAATRDPETVTVVATVTGTIVPGRFFSTTAQTWSAVTNITASPPVYPDVATVPRKTNVKRIPTEDVDIGGDGSVHATQTSEKAPYQISVNHPFITAAHLAVLRTFIDQWGGATITIEDASGRTFEGQLPLDLDEAREVSSVYWDATIAFKGNLVP